jgi:hypothetical protein
MVEGWTKTNKDEHGYLVIMGGMISMPFIWLVWIFLGGLHTDPLTWKFVGVATVVLVIIILLVRPRLKKQYFLSNKTVKKHFPLVMEEATARMYLLLQREGFPFKRSDLIKGWARFFVTVMEEEVLIGIVSEEQDGTLVTYAPFEDDGRSYPLLDKLDQAMDNVGPREM